MKKNTFTQKILALSIAVSVPVFADIENKFDWSNRTRYAQFAGDDDAKAASILLRGTVNTHWNDEFSSTLQIDHVNTFFDSEYSDGARLNGKPLIPDPAGTDINQAFIAYNTDDLLVKAGRQRINFDDQRFIGGNAFWQNEQTFDAVLGKYKFLSNSNFTYGYIFNVNRIFGDDADKYLHPGDAGYGGADSERPASFLGEHKHDTHVARLEWNEWDYTQIVSYAYAIDNRTMPSTSNNTFGASYAFHYKADAINYRILIEAAAQQHTEINNSPTLPYYLLDANMGINKIELNARYEILGNKEGISFITPLGSGHDFQGLANQVLNIDNNGIKDSSLGLTWRLSPFKIETHYHHFIAYTNNQHIADELDMVLSYKPSRKHSVSLLLTDFMPENYVVKNNTKKLYLDYAYNF